MFDRLVNRDRDDDNVLTLTASKGESRQIKKQRKGRGDPSVFEGEDAFKGPWASYSEDSESSFEDDEQEQPQIYDVEPPPQAAIHTISRPPSETSEYFGPEGVPLMDTPFGVKLDFSIEPGSQKCYVPKKRIHVFSGHRGGVQAIQFLPRTGHLLLSCGNDNSIKIWDTYRGKHLARGYYGHTKPVKFVQFNSDGTRFLSCSYDKYVKLWDTETGNCLYKKRLRSFPNVVKFNPNNENEFLVGTTRMTVEHYDVSTDEIIQTYEHHMGSVNYLEFIASDQNFVTSSEDKSLKIWDLRINMPIKQIADPKQHSMPYLREHPGGNYFVAQSMDNTIVTFSSKKADKFRRIKKKTFRGHNSAGYSVGVQFTPDGRNLVSGDSYGYTYFWDWNTTKLVKRIKVDEKVISCVDTHPIESSMVAMAGISGNIYLYD
ncbi:DEKNAAC100171 [Brettanomyces naardenensis]|uniref:Pre-mRNA-processing factor 17 n=1 Tax=Brettanomyces naardenensis TaxID=13370 RepID=A0A448YGR5_BRENA|nr:DEKNAAC100171 [Brettanomyces naardenensis]